MIDIGMLNRLFLSGKPSTQVYPVILPIRRVSEANVNIESISRLYQWFFTLPIIALTHSLTLHETRGESPRPHIILVMADDQGWGQTGYYNHPVLRTPNLDKMASRGIRFDRFYAGAPVCSPTRASVLTGRANDRTGVESHGYALRRQEITIAQILQKAGYATGHFGKWHLNGIRGPGVPILAKDQHGPGNFGFETWVSVTNFFDLNPILSRGGNFEEMRGDSSEVSVREAIRFIDENHKTQPTFSVVWYGSPHDPAKASEQDRRDFLHLDEKSQNHYGELVAMDRSIGTLFAALEERGIQDTTLVWFCSDNGGLPKIKPSSVGNLRGNKGTIFEGGLRVPGIIHWPAIIKTPRVTSHPASVLDILPTVLDITEIKHSDPNHSLDGISLKPLFESPSSIRTKPIPFRHLKRAAWIDNEYKVLTQDMSRGDFELYNLENDPGESNNLATAEPERLQRMVADLKHWSESVDRSVAGNDYQAGKVLPGDPAPRFWTEMKAYQPYFEQWRKRWEYESRLNPKQNRSKSKKP